MAGRILIADNVATNRIILKVKLTAARYEVAQADSGPEVRAMAIELRPDLVILDASLPGGALAVCAALKADPVTRTIPVLIIDAVASRAARIAALRAGADDYLAKPLDETALLALVRNLMRTRATFDELARRQETSAALGFGEATDAFARPARIALVAPSPDAGIGWRRGLGLALAARITTLSKAEALTPARGAPLPDAYVIAADLAQRGDGLRMISELRSRPDSRHAVIVILDRPESGPTGATIGAMALDLGADAVVAGGFDAEEIAARLDALVARKLETDALRDSLDERLNLAMTDPLTGLYNRRYGEAYLARIAAEAMRTGQPFALMLLDLDRFKAVNDTFGHLVGDEVLVETARRLRRNLRQIDLIARYGGEEFVIALPETDHAAASVVAERLRRVVGETPIEAPSRGLAVTVTISIGVAVFSPEAGGAGTLAALFSAADSALYAAKAEGRNLVSFAGGRAA